MSYRPRFSLGMRSIIYIPEEKAILLVLGYVGV